MTDLIKGAESDSGLRLRLTCPQCGQPHSVALTRLDGRFAFTCCEVTACGQVDDWSTFKLAQAMQKGTA